MENFNQIESDILNKIKNVSNRNSLDSVKTEIFGKKGIITELFKKIGSLDQSQRKLCSRLDPLDLLSKYLLCSTLCSTYGP